MHPLERLLNLLTLLLESPRPLTFDRIREVMPVYAEGEPASAKRMFERDKDTLREVGVPLEVVPTDAWEVEEGYVVRPERYYVPEITFTPEEVAALLVAANSPGSGGADAASALRKLALGADAAVLADVAAAPQPGGVDASGPHLAAVARGLAERRTLGFSYRRADGEEEARTVDPFGLVFRGGTWYVVGEDRDRGELRAFRLSRITSGVRDAGTAADPPAGFRAADHVTVPGAAEDGTARVAFSEKVAWWAMAALPGAREAGRGEGWVEAEVPVAGRDAFVSWVAGLGPDARVVSPEDLRGAVVAHLEAVRARL